MQEDQSKQHTPQPQELTELQRLEKMKQEIIERMVQRGFSREVAESQAEAFM